MNLHPAEEATIRGFVRPARRERLLALLANPARRGKALNALNHFHDWDPRRGQLVATSGNVLRLLQEAGAPTVCHVISDDPEIDGCDLPLAEAVAATDAFSFASVSCCDPGRLAFFFDESAAPRPQILL